MVLRRNRLLYALDQVREEIIQEGVEKSGKKPVVCSDLVLEEIAKKKPLKISDFLAIQGIGKSFMDNYAMRFLRTVLAYQTIEANEVKVSKEAYEVLDHYKDRLTNISRRNPNLYMGKTTKKRSFDLSMLQLDTDIIEFITNKRISTLPLSFFDNYQGEIQERHITTLYRETNKDLKETGSYDLYIAYPYIEGVFKQDRFAIKAPLLYIPVKLVRNKREFVMKKDKEKDIIFNRDLLLATSKMEKHDVEIKTPILDKVSLSNIEQIVIPFYKKYGINIKEQQVHFQFEPYKAERKEDFGKRRAGVFHLKEYLTLGRYKLYSSMIQKDINDILNAQKYNDLLEGLIDENNLYDEEKSVPFSLDNQKVTEDKLSYINEVNFAQEKVINLLNMERKLVIWGPPGTGKSQTITNLLAASIMKGENILVISEKKVALDVIHSRLKNAAKYTMFIDDVEAKQEFYNQVKNFIDPLPPSRTKNNDIYELELEIEELVKTLDHSIDLLYNQKIQEVPIHTLYKRFLKDNEIINKLSPKRVHAMFKETFGNPTFKKLAKVEEVFSKRKSLQDYLGYEVIKQQFPIFEKLETKITRSNRIVLNEFTEKLNEYYETSEGVWFFKKRKLRKAFLDKHSKKLLFLTNKPRVDASYLKLALEDRTLHDYIVDNINKLDKLRTKHQKLTNDQLLYINMLLKHRLLDDYTDRSKYHDYLFNAFYTGYLDDFYTKNQDQLYIINKYQEKMQRLQELQNEKREVTIESFETELYKHAFTFSNTKRIMDVKRVLDSPRKPSIKGFIDIFQLELLNNIRIWMMTPEVVSAVMPLIYGMFDLVIFDEASQMYVEKGIPAIYRAKKVVIAGDTKQLRPSSLGMGRIEEDDDLYEEDILKDISLDAKSLLDLARYRFKETILNYHYRSQYEELIAFSNHAFYEGNLIVSPNQRQSEKAPIEYIHVPNGIFDQRRNEEEAKQVIKVLRKIFREREHNETIGVITFNSAQRDLIENHIDEELFKRGKYQKLFEKELFRTEDDEDKSLFIKNIENVQGDERDIIIFSMGYARNMDGVIRRNFGWLNNDGGQNRLNVAISRAKKKIYFVSSLLPEELKVDDLKSTGPKLLKAYMRYCYFVSQNKSDLAKEVLEQIYQTEVEDKESITSHLVEDIKKRLERNNYEVRTEIGIGAYHINLAVYDSENKTYKLGIICDVDTTKQNDARRDLYHQEVYLQSRKWNTYRVFASNWYKDPNAEMRNIRKLLK